MSNLNTVDIPKGGGGIPKTLKPGNQVCQITSVELKPFTFKPGALELHLSMEGIDLGPEFQGFFINKDNESLGRHKGQVGRVKATEWAFSDGETKGGIKISRDMEIMKWLNNFCEAIGKKEWMTAQDQKHPTIESLVEAFSKDAPFKGLDLNLCVAGKEYVAKGFTNYELFLPKFTKAGVPYELLGAAKSKLVVYNEATHIIKKKVETVTNFSAEGDDVANPTAGLGVQSDFEL